MFEIRPELLEITQKYQELIKNSQFTGVSNVAKYVFETFLVIIALSISCCIISVIIPSIFKTNKNLETFFNKATDYLLAISLLPFVVAIIIWCHTGDISDRIANSVIQEYNLKHESNNPLKNFDEKWLKGLMINPKIKTTTLFKPKNECVCREDVNPPSVKYMQIEPAPEGDAPVVESQVVTKSEMTKHNSTYIPVSDVQLIKIEKKEDTTLITTHIKINNQWYKTQLQESLLDLIIEGQTQQYYDDAQGKILVGVLKKDFKPLPVTQNLKNPTRAVAQSLKGLTFKAYFLG